MSSQRRTYDSAHDSRARRRALLRALGAAPLAGLLALSLTACAPEPSTASAPDVTAEESAEQSAPAATAEEAPADPALEEPTEPTEPAEPIESTKPAAPVPADCGWDVAPIPANLGAVPTGQSGDLSQVLPGAWQHVAIDEGGGYVDSMSADIRYVFPSTSELIYCQDVPGITDLAENRAAVQLEGNEIVLPAPATGYAVQSWNQDSMVWLNHRDGSLYLLQRR